MPYRMTSDERDTPGPVNPADFAPIPIDPVLALRLTLGEMTRAIIDLEDVRDNATKSIADIQERMESIRREIKCIKPIVTDLDLSRCPTCGGLPDPAFDQDTSMYPPEPGDEVISTCYEEPPL